MRQRGSALLCAMLCLQVAVLPALAQSSKTARGKAAGHRKMSRKAVTEMVALDAKDNRYYSVAYAKKHHMRDHGGDVLTLIPKSKLPPGAKPSRREQRERNSAAARTKSGHK